MRRLVVSLVAAVVLSVCTLSYATPNSNHKVLVYKGSLKTAKTLFDVNSFDTASGSLPYYWAVDVCDATGSVLDSNAVFIGKYSSSYRVTADAVTISPHDPCNIEMFILSTADADGTMVFRLTGKGKLTQVYDINKTDPNTKVKKFVVTSLKGAGFFTSFNMFNPDPEEDGTYSGTVTLSMTLDAKSTKKTNAAGGTVDDAINAIIATATKKGTWTRY
jgi:hypothetical protein